MWWRGERRARGPPDLVTHRAQDPPFGHCFPNILSPSLSPNRVSLFLPPSRALPPSLPEDRDSGLPSFRVVTTSKLSWQVQVTSSLAVAALAGSESESVPGRGGRGRLGVTVTVTVVRQRVTSHGHAIRLEVRWHNQRLSVYTHAHTHTEGDGGRG